MEENRRRDFVDRRKGPDIWVRIVQWLGFMAWGIMFVILTITDRAKPEAETFFERFFKIQVRNSWNQDLLQFAFYLMLLLNFLCIFGLIINSRRCRRKSDKYNLSLVLMMILAFVGIAMYFVNFML
ncbi:MAG: hypothetical protein ACOYVK_15565 [Bacillota bacterium]